MTEKYTDNLIIGAGLVGALVARMLTQRGERGVLLEKSGNAGGINGSFTDQYGNWFDHGRHVINYDRSEFTSRFVNEVLKGRIRRFDLERSIVVHGQCIPYAAELDDWPGELREKIKLDPSVKIRLGSKREEFRQAYGSWFGNLVFDEMLPAYPVLSWKRQRGIPEENLLDLIFPWFFPRSEAEAEPESGAESGVYSEESRMYHYRCRHSEPPREEVMYPDSEGFGKLIQEMLNDSRENFELLMGVEDIRIDIDPDTLAVNRVGSGDRDYRAGRVFWCAPLPVLCKYLGWRLPAGEPQWELLGSYTFRDPVRLQDHEVLFADPEFRIRRVNNPGLIAGNANSRTLQVEYTTLNEEAGKPEEKWREQWLDDLRRLGFVDSNNEVVDFDFRKLPRGIVSTEDLGRFLEECEKRIAEAESNLIAPHLAVASDNNSRLIPKVSRRIDRALAEN